MKICVVGGGRQGRVAAQDLAESGYRVTVLDINKKNLKNLSQHKNITTRVFTVENRKQFVKLLKKFDLIVGALPARLGRYLMECAIDAGIDLVDLSYLPEDPFLLDKKAKAKKVRIVPDAGFAPGLSNIIVGRFNEEFGGLDYIKIMVGGLPQKPVPPFNYYITWSPVDLIEEYTRTARIVRNDKILKIEPLTGIEEFKIPRIGRLEAFYTDGLRTLLRTFKKTKNMEEKTIRYTGHARIFKTLIDIGLFSDRKIKINRSNIILKNFTLEFLKEALTRGDEKDISILRIELKKGRKRCRIECIDYYDTHKKITSMARLTAYTGSIIAQHIKEYPKFGVIAPEYLGQNRDIWDKIETELKKRRIKLSYR